MADETKLKWCTMRWTFDPGANVGHKPTSPKDAARLLATWKSASLNIRGICVTRGEGWSGDLLIADCEDLENLPASDILVKRFKHQEVAQEGKLSLPCPDGSLKLLDLPQLPRGDMRAWEKREQDEREEEDSLFDEEKTETTLGARVVTSFVIIMEYIEPSGPSKMKQLSPFQ